MLLFILIIVFFFPIYLVAVFLRAAFGHPLEVEWPEMTMVTGNPRELCDISLKDVILFDTEMMQ